MVNGPGARGRRRESRSSLGGGRLCLVRCGEEASYRVASAGYTPTVERAQERIIPFVFH